MSASSVLTITAENNLPTDNALSIVCAINGLPLIDRMFFFGTLFEPPRAGITARVSNVSRPISFLRADQIRLLVLQSFLRPYHLRKVHCFHIFGVLSVHQ